MYERQLKADVLPAVIPRTPEDVLRVVNAINERPLAVHVDYVGRIYGGQVGGEYMPAKTAFPSDASCEVHIMDKDVGRITNHFLACGVGRVIFQSEAYSDAIDDLKNLASTVHARGAEFGVALLLETDLHILEKLAPFVDVVQLMSIAHIGAQGHAFDERVLGRITTVKELYSFPVSVDGGIDARTARIVQEAGADRLVVGSAIVKSGDMQRAYEEIKQSLVS